MHSATEAAGEPRSAYHRAAEADSTSFLANRDHMLAFFKADVRRMPATQWPLSPPTALAARVLQWNLNVLMGVSGRDPARPEDVMALIRRVDADVVLLQEASVQRFAAEIATGYSEYFQQDLARLNGRIERLHTLLQDAGYQIIISGDGECPPLLATRLRIEDEGSSIAIDREFPARGTQGVGRLVQLALRGGTKPRRLGVLMTHLESTQQGGLEGVRQAEVASLLRGWRDAGGNSAASPMTATVLSGDLNFPRRGDLREREWVVVKRGLEKLGEPLKDGVAETLTAAGFRCAYDLSCAGAPAFTHWTATTVDFTWCHFQQPAQWRVSRAEVLPTELSDHLPIVTDLEWLEAPAT